jgi:hypothetical protein
MTYPAQVFSLSHVAIPFPMDDELYGIQPTDAGNPRFGVSLGAIAPRGERGALMVSLDSMFRISSNPFFPYLLARIDEVIAEPARASGARPSGARRAGLRRKRVFRIPTPSSTRCCARRRTWSLIQW